MKSTNGNADVVRPQVGFPKHRRSACRAKMHPDLSSLLPVADIDFGRSIRANMLLLEKGNNAEHRAGPPLTLATVADAYGIGIGRCFDTQGTAAAMRSSCHRTPPFCRCTETTGGRFSERPLTLRRACGSGADFETLPEGASTHTRPSQSRGMVVMTGWCQADRESVA